MAFVPNEGATVATGMSPIVEAGIYADAVFIDGYTFTSKFDIGSVGQVQVVKYAGGKGVDPVAPAANFTHRDYQNTVIEININNCFQDSVKVPKYYESTMPIDLMMDKTLEVSMNVGMGRQQSAIAALVHQSTKTFDTIDIEADNVYSKIIGCRSDMANDRARPDVVLLSPYLYGMVQEASLKNYTPMFNDDLMRSGKVFKWMGLLWVECNLLDGTTTDYKYRDEANTLQTVDTKDVDFIMYNHNAFSILDRLDGLRAIPSPDFMGTLVQESLTSAFKVTNDKCVLVGKSKT